MRKLRLELETLVVETFAPAAEGAPRRGTVRGREDGTWIDCGTFPDSCGADTCGNQCYTGPNYVSCDPTEEASCDTCDASCGISCPDTCRYYCGPDVQQPVGG